MVIAVTRREHTPAELRAEAAATHDPAAARRMLALALVMEGRTRTEAARSCGMDRQTLRDWVHRYNAEGLAGLRDRLHPGRPPRLSGEQQTELARILRAGPGPERRGRTRWRSQDVRVLIKDRFGVELTERSVARLLQKIGTAPGQPLR